MSRVAIFTAAAILSVVAIDRHELQARCAARCLIYTPSASRGVFGTGPYGIGADFDACIKPCPDVKEKNDCFRDCTDSDAVKQANCSSTCLFLEQIRSEDSATTPRKQLPTKLSGAPAFDPTNLVLSWSVDPVTLYRDPNYAKYGVSFVVEYVAVTRAQSTNATLVRALAWTPGSFPTLMSEEPITNVVPTPNPSRLYVFRVSVYNQFGTRGPPSNNGWSLPFNLSLYYTGDSSGGATDVPPFCVGAPGLMSYPGKPENLQHDEYVLENDADGYRAAVNITWDPPLPDKNSPVPSCYEVILYLGQEPNEVCKSIRISRFVPAATTRYELTGLHLSCYYYTAVISHPLGNKTEVDHNQIAFSVPGCISVLCTEDDGAPRNFTVTYDVDKSEEYYRALISWRHPFNKMGIIKYQLRWETIKGGREVIEKRSISPNTSVNGYFSETVNELTPQGTYTFKIQAEAEVGVIRKEAVKKITLPSIWSLVRDVTVETAGRDVNVTWFVTKSFYEVQSYQLQWGFDAMNSTATTKSLPSTQNSYVLVGLHPDTAYYVTVRATSRADLYDELREHFMSPPSLYTKAASKTIVIVAVVSAVLILVIVTSILFIMHRRRVEKKSLTIASLPTASLGLTADGRFPLRKPFVPKCPPDDWEVDPSRIRILELLGEGFFGVVVKAEVVSRSASTAIAHIEPPAPPAQSDAELQRARVASSRALLSSSASVNVACAASYTAAAAVVNFSVPRTLVAIKMLKDAANEAEQRDLYAEIALMKRIGSHRHIVSILGAVTQSLPLMLLIEYVPNGDLLTFLRRSRQSASSSVAEPGGALMNQYTREPKSDYHDKMKRSQKTQDPPAAVTGDDNDNDDDDDDVFTSKDKPSPGPLGSGGAGTPLTQLDLVTFARQIALGLEYLHSRGVVHRDLACRNVLVGDNRQLKVSDFGLARAVYQDKAYVSKKRSYLPFKWMSIEALVDRVFTPQSDVWSFGVVLWEIFALGGHPYPAVPDDQLVDYLKAGYRMDKPDGRCPDEIYDLMKQCWQPEARYRPAVSHLIERLSDALRSQVTSSRRCRSYSNRTTNQWLSASDLDSEEPSSRSTSIS